MLPDRLLSSLEEIPSFDRASFEQVHASGEQVVSVRFNPAKIDIEHASPAFESFPLAQKIPWTSEGYYLPQRPSFTRDPLFHAGVYYVQDPSSMFVEHALRQTIGDRTGLRILDLCAAPGGKSTLLQSVLPADSLLVSNEVIKTRVTVLHQNMTRWGGSNGMITQNDPKDFSALEGYFDLMLVDAPCSGSGLFRKDPDAVAEWSPEAVTTCSLRQRRILTDSWHCLKPGGILLYATCSYSKAENEDIVDWLLKSEPAETVRLTMPGSWGIVESLSDSGKGYGYRFYPDRLSGEGFFLSVIRKTGGESFEYPNRNQQRHLPVSKAAKQAGAQYIIDAPEIDLIDHGDLLYALRKEQIRDFYFLRDHLYLKKAGIQLGKIAGKELLPEQELALSTLVHPSVPRLELRLEEAIQYLRKEDFVPLNIARGWALVQYREQTLGWVKMLDRRMNNYYPKTWRILH